MGGIKEHRFALILVGIVLIFVGFFIFFGSDSCEGAACNNQSQSTEYSTSVITTEVENNEAELIDVRSQVEYDSAHAQNAELFNVEWMKEGRFPDIPKDKKIYVYCRSGNRSAQAASLMRQEGFMNIVDLGAFSNWSDKGGQISSTEMQPYEDLLAEIGADPIAPLGDVDAPVTMVKYSDFQCPFCLRYSNETEPSIVDQYVKTGKVAYYFRNVAYQGDASMLAGEAGYCANEQQLFWEFHDELNRNITTVGSESALNRNSLKSSAGRVGAEPDAFEECLDSGKYTDVIVSETIQANNKGITGTPGFMIDGELVNGALPFSAFKGIIESKF